MQDNSSTRERASRLLARARTAAFGLIAAMSAAQAIESPGVAPDPGTVREWHFKVFLDGKPIGAHEFVVTRRAADEVVKTTAHFKVSAFFVPVYHYDHEDRETWAGGCLSQIDARTDDNGRKLQVRGRISAGKFALAGSANATNFPDCVKTFAYWDRDSLSDPHLLNSETGEYTAAELRRRGSEQIHIGEHTEQAEHYSLQTGKFAIDLWYSQAGEWLALQTLTSSGHTLRYEAT